MGFHACSGWAGIHTVALLALNSGWAGVHTVALVALSSGWAGVHTVALVALNSWQSSSLRLSFQKCLKIIFIYLLYACVHLLVSRHWCGDQKATCGGLFSPIMYILGIKLTS